MIMTAEEFVTLLESTIPEEYSRAAHETAAVGVWLDVIARFPHLKRWVTYNKTIQIEILELLALDIDSGVRSAVATKNSLPLQLMESLSRDEEESVRMRIACNKKAPAHVLRNLCYDPSAEVSTVAKERLAKKGIP